jgi:hypothetical protein
LLKVVDGDLRPQHTDVSNHCQQTEIDGMLLHVWTA